MDGLYYCTPRTTRGFVVDCISAALVPFIQSSPGIGKSSLVKDIAEEFNLQLIDVRLSTADPTDLTGLPAFVDGKASFHPFDIFPTADQELPEGKDGWMLFLDEFNSATKMVQAAAYKLVLDRMVGQHHLHPNVAVVLAGNLASDRAIVNQLSTAMQSRLVHIMMKESFEEWLEDVAFKQDYDHRIISFLNYKKGHLMNFKPDHSDKTFCCPRTWEFMNRLVKGKDITDEKIPLYAGTISEGVAVDFVQYIKVYQSLPSVKDVVKDPSGTPIPQNDSAKCWAVVGHLMENVDEDNFGPISEYVGRLGVEFRILFFRSMMSRKPGLRAHPQFARSMSEMSRYLHAA